MYRRRWNVAPRRSAISVVEQGAWDRRRKRACREGNGKKEDEKIERTIGRNRGEIRIHGTREIDICAVAGESAMFYCYMIRITWVARCTERAERAVTLREKKSSYHLHIALLLYEHCNGTLRLKSNKNIKRGRQPSITVGDFLGRPRNSPIGFKHPCPATRQWTSILPTSMLCHQFQSVIFSSYRSLLFTEWESFPSICELSGFTSQSTACWSSFCEIAASEEESLRKL